MYTENDSKKLLIGSPILQKPPILRAFLESLEKLDTAGLDCSYFFVDDNTDPDACALLQAFQGRHPAVILLKGQNTGGYHCDETTHYWNNNLMDRVGQYKDQIIRYALSQAFDYLFFVDSDLILDPKLIRHLISCEKEIISEIFWTKWTPDSIPLPNVWLFDQYNLSPQDADERLDAAASLARRQEFLHMLKAPGQYPVGGLGACTMISKTALEKGVNFSRIPNLLSLWGEDRFFCVRAAALGIPLFVDTHYPALHLYREADLEAFTAKECGIPGSATAGETSCTSPS